MAILQSNPFIGHVARRFELREFWRWWMNELRVTFAPLSMFAARWLIEADVATEITLDGQALTVGDWDLDASPDPSRASVSRIKLQGVDPGMLRQIAETALRGRPRDLRITLASEVCLTKFVVYPRATEENLREVLGFDMDRQTPFNAAQVYFDVRVVKHSVDNAERASITAELVVVPRYALDPVLTALRASGASIRSISIKGDSGSPHFELLSRAERPRRRLTSRQKLNLAIASVVVLLAAFAMLLPIWQKYDLIQELRPLVREARTKAELTRRVESEFTLRAQDYNFAVGKKYAAYPTVEILDELSRLSPDTTWLQTLEMKSAMGKIGAMTREIQVTGEAASASHMIELFEQSRLLQNTSQRAQTTRGSQTGTERFQIASEVKARPLPAAAKLVDKRAGEVLPLAPQTASVATQPATLSVESTAEGQLPVKTAPNKDLVPPPRIETQGMAR